MALTQAQINRAKAIRADIDGRIADNVDKPDVLLNMAERVREWSQGAYAVGDVRRYGDKLYKCIQSHDSTGNSGWSPKGSPSLWAEVLVSDTTILEWKQPESTNPYSKGDKVLFDGNVYESLIDNNSWSPSGYPAGWKKI